MGSSRVPRSFVYWPPTHQCHYCRPCFCARHGCSCLTILFQNIVAALILWRGGKIGWFEIKPLQRSQFSKMAVTAVLNSLKLITSMNSLPYVAISTTVVFRNISTLLCAIVEMLIFKETFSFRAKVSLVTIFLGSVLYAMRDLSFDARGYAWRQTLSSTPPAIFTKNR